eukprot:Opistho-2@80454
MHGATQAVRIQLLAKSVISEARTWVARMINAHADEILFTSGGTESNNLVFHSVLQEYKADGSVSRDGEGPNAPPAEATHAQRPHFILSTLEHDSIILPVKAMAAAGLVDYTLVRADTRGFVQPESIVSAITPATRLVTLMLANNEIGTIQRVRDIARASREAARAVGVAGRLFVHTDAAQALGKITVDVNELEVDYLTVVGHKFYAPRIGALFVRELGRSGGAPLHPMLFGGGQERNYRPGTENTGMIAGLGKAAQLVCESLPAYASAMRTSRDLLEQRLVEQFGAENVAFNGRPCDATDADQRLPNTCNVSILLGDYSGYELLSRCARLRASVGAACHSANSHKASHILLGIGVDEAVAMRAVRLTVGRETTANDVDVAVQDLVAAVNAPR